jgi:hypothetical protein
MNDHDRSPVCVVRARTILGPLRPPGPRWWPAGLKAILPCAALLAALAASGPGDASSGTINLGALTNATNQYHPLGFFRHVTPGLGSGHLPEVMLLASEFDNGSITEKWAVVKALQQFGVFHGLTPTTGATVCDPHVTDHCTLIPGPATIRLVHASYRSRYLTFDHKDLIDAHQKLLQPLSAAERVVFMRYAYRKPPRRAQSADPNPYWTIAGPHWPVLVVGDYVQTSSSMPITDLEDFGGRPYSFAQLQQALQRNDLHTEGAFVGDVNAEANIIAALICHADGRQPAAICARPIILQLLHRVKS